MLAFAAAIFLGALLLFQVQPIMGKFILPWFGGGGDVWTACMLVFQSLLLAGYAYAHWLTRLRPRSQAMVHGALLAAALLFVPLAPAEFLKPADASLPALRILLLVTVSVGLPYFVLASTSPLMQAWFARRRPGRSPYRLYALSNAGSLLGLLSFPLLIEPLLTRVQASWVWSGGMVAFVAASAYCAVQAARAQASVNTPQPQPQQQAPKGLKKQRKTDAVAAGSEVVTRSRQLLWFGLPAAASVVLLGVTSAISQDLAVVPLLWIVPLALYLLTFIVAFADRRLYSRPVFAAGLMACVVAFVPFKQHADSIPMAWQLAMLCATLVFACMVAHGELARLRPHPSMLTRYYLLIAAGGAAGGAVVALVAPLVFQTYTELPVGLLAICLMMLTLERRSFVHRLKSKAIAPAIVVVVLLGSLAADRAGAIRPEILATHRNFYGVLTLRVFNAGTQNELARLAHGSTFHGLQFRHPGKRDLLTAYYSPTSGVGRAIQSLPDRARRVGVVGLGVGTLAGYGRAGDTFRFYEINPAVEVFARRHFSYLSATPAAVEVVLGDARLSLEREQPGQFDLLVVDAFSGDAVPVHLLTVEAMRTYLHHVGEDGIIALHISSRHLDLSRVVYALAGELDLSALLVSDDQDESRGTYASTWMLLSRSGDALRRSGISAFGAGRPPRLPAPWTDDRASIFDVLP